jgi:tetratricopeptide (TPR) repeat protein
MSGWTPKFSLPRADSHRFSVGVAHLEYDESYEFEDFLGESIHNFDRKTGVEPLRFDRTICLEGQPEEAEKRGHEKARQYLRESGAQVLVWGAVRGKKAVRLYWTSSTSGRESESAYLPKDFELPTVLQKDLMDILKLIILTQSAQYFPREGHYITDQLAPFIERVRQLMIERAQQTGWDVDTLAGVNLLLANAQATFGDQKGDNRSLKEAVTAYDEALKEWTRERAPLKWAMTQNNLGSALRVLGERESGTMHLEQAVLAYNEALKGRLRQRVPLDWAGTQNGLCGALTVLGKRESGTTHLEQAVTACNEALKERTRERVPLYWATTQNNLGTALRSLGERESGTTHLEQAVMAYHEALKERTRELAPLKWAETQHNLGNVLEIIGERKRDPTLLCAALGDHAGAWEVFSSGAPYYASIAAKAANKDIAVFEQNLDRPQYQKCFAEHREALLRMGVL